MFPSSDPVVLVPARNAVFERQSATTGAQVADFVGSDGSLAYTRMTTMQGEDLHAAHKIHGATFLT